MGHINTLDMGFTFFMAATLAGFLLGQTEAAGRRWMLLAWAALALAVLSKGIVAIVLTGGTLVLYSLLTRDFSPWRKFEFARGLPLFLLIGAPWFVAVSLANPEFAHFFFIHEHFERFLTKVHHRYQPAWYFIHILLLGALPWTTLALRALPRAWARRPAAAFQPLRFLLLWCLVVFGFFSVSSSKLPSYILPLFPALALLLAETLPRLGRKTLLGHLAIVALAALACLILAPRVARLADEVTPIAMMGAYADWLTAAAAVWLLGSLAAIGLAWRARPTAAVLLLAAASGLAGMGTLLGHENLSASNSAYHIAMRVKPLLPPGVPFYSVQTYDQTLPYYLGRTVTLVDYQDEMAFGIEQEPDRWIASMAEFAQRWRGDSDAFAFMTPEEFAALRKENLPMTVVARDTRRVVVRKTPQ
jgi:4-amino-4-deoxy-L-arabinose transferase-like glycosyltransferase